MKEGKDMQNNVCNGNHEHKNCNINEFKEFNKMSELFKVFGDTTRIRILYALFESELCVNDIAQVLGLSQSAVSHQLRILKDAKLVKFRRNGKIIFYSLDDDHVRNIIAMGMEHVEE